MAGKSLAERLASLSNPEPVFHDPEAEDDITAAKVAEVEHEADDENFLSTSSSKLRSKNASLLEGDARYKGKKVSRAALAKQRGIDPADAREHAAAELGHMFDLGGDDDETDEGSDDGDDVEASGSDEYDDEMETEGEKDSDGKEDDEDEVRRKKIDSDETDDEEIIHRGLASGTKQFSFDASDNNFGKYGDMEEEENEEEDEDDDDDDDNDDENDGGSEEEDEEVDAGAEERVEGPGQIRQDSLAQEVAKGRAVQKQLHIWDKLLETRIQEQRLLSRINRFPAGKFWQQLVEAETNSPAYAAAVKDSQKSLKLLLEELLRLESVLCSRAGQAEAGASEEPAAKKRKLNEFAAILSSQHTNFVPERDNLIQKWNDKTRIFAARGTGNSSKSFAVMETSTLAQIQQILANRPRLVARTQLKRSNYDILATPDVPAGEGDSGLQETNVNIFDDDDFYHQLLRDLIDRKTNSSSDQSQLTRQWLEVQKLRTKLKKKVDTKASKGRKVRYDIHSKLVNFMAPVYNYCINDESKNQLFASLFGGKK